MQTLPSYKEQYDKIIDAYFKGEIKPMDSKFCICGTLDNNDSSWCDYGIKNGKHYTQKEYGRIEYALLNQMRRFGVEYEFAENNHTGGWCGPLRTDKSGYEDALFSGMCAALEVLKQIHIEHGETIEDTPVFTKRNMLTV